MSPCISFKAIEPNISYLHPLSALTFLKPRAIWFISSLFAMRSGEILCFSAELSKIIFKISVIALDGE